jgi:uncharacterized protein (TIGR03437 family)
MYVAGSNGPGAQTQPDNGAHIPILAAVTDGVLATIRRPSNVPGVNLTQIVNAFSLQPGPIAPGEIVYIGVPGFVPAQTLDIGLNVLAALTTNLGGVQVTFDGMPAYIMSVTNGRIECIVPVGISGQSSTALQVSINGSASNVLNVSVAPTALGLLSADGSGSGSANARNADGSLNSRSNPAAAGSVVTFYFTGAGVTSPAEMDGVVPRTTAIAPVAITSSICGDIYALPGFAPGLFACSYVIPTLPAGPQSPVQVSSQASQSQELFVYVK